MEDYLLNLPPEVVQQLYAEAFLTAQNTVQLYSNQAAPPSNEQVPEEEAAPVNQVYRGEKDTSKNGVYPVLIYEIPDSERCYIFQRHKKTSREDTVIYRCSGCKRQNGKYTSVLVSSNRRINSSNPGTK
ncbi:hypothetical protein Y032_0134g1868 [Ancylostoma ceylanicum]|uniref:Uncharacterized protein n=1 Tax=Ancylostoma ceylanicum TaxID=53326 RepID=A0A016T6A3_9BILA|nr:hypothetical protein Y032_0134g1868 [Ancylostoma ceylanicum]